MNAEEKARLARQLIARFAAIEALPRQEFPPVQRAYAPPAPTPDAKAVQAAYLATALAGVGFFDRAGRAQAKARAEAAANHWLAATLTENENRRAAYQHALDIQWNRLVANEPTTVVPALEAAFAAHRPSVAVVGVDGAAVSLAVASPPLSEVPDRMPARTQAGNLSLRKLTKTEINAWYAELLAGHLLVAAKRAFAAAPGLAVAHIVALDQSGPDGALMATSVRRDSLAELRGARTRATELLDVAADHLLLRTGGAARALLPLDILAGSQLREARAAFQRRSTPPAPVLPPAYEVQPPTAALQTLRAAVPRSLAPAPPALPSLAAASSTVPPASLATAPAGWVSPPRRKHRIRNVAAVVILALLGIGWLGNLGSGEDARQTMTADIVQAQPKAVAILGVTDGGLVRLKDATGKAHDVALAHAVTPAAADCLGPESTAKLRALLPAGTVVEGHESGELSVGGVLVAAELARAGLAVAAPAGSTADPGYRAIAAAQEEARAAQAGVYSPSVACTIPAQLAALTAA
ncbi:MAG: hypothetical protein EOM10_12975, partial [Opitutae bacterium]|nr:hypothetical protein [Opitutae bacterium]